MQYFALGTALVTRDELVEKTTLGSTQEFTKKYGSRPEDARLEFSVGNVRRENMVVTLATGAKRVDFFPVGQGLPLTIEIRQIYTGDQPRKSFFQSDKDMLVTSAVKGIGSYDGAPRAVNFVRRKVTPGTSISEPLATERGTPLVFYSPAMTQAASVMTIETKFDEFPDQVFQTLGNAFTGAAGVPVFAAQSVYLLAAGMITKLLGNAGHTMFDGHTGFSVTDELSFQRPGAIIPVADYRLITQNNFDTTVLRTHHLDADGVLVSDAEPSKKYDGPCPYVVVSLDGRKVDEYEKFTPTAASAALLDQFFAIKEGTEQPVQQLIDAFKLYSDFNFRTKADKLKADLQKLAPSSEEYKKKEAELAAVVKNILTDALKPGIN